MPLITIIRSESDDGVHVAVLERYSVSFVSFTFCVCVCVRRKLREAVPCHYSFAVLSRQFRAVQRTLRLVSTPLWEVLLLSTTQ